VIHEDHIGTYRQLSSGKVLRIDKRFYNTLLTLSANVKALTWEHGW